MSSANTLPPPPAPTDPNMNAVPDAPTSVSPSVKDRIGGALGGILKAAGGDTSTMDQNLKDHYSQRLAEAQMNQKHAQLYGTILAHAHQTASATAPFGVDPTTGQPMTKDQYDYYTNAYNTSMAAFGKSAGVNKQGKGMVNKIQQVAGHVIGALPGQTPGAGATKPGMPAPPTPGGGAGATSAAAGPSGPASPTSASSPSFPPPPPSMLQQGLDDAHTNAQEDAKQAILAKYKIQEEQALEKAKSDAEAKKQSATRPVMGPAISVSNARTLAREGKSFVGADGNPIDLTSLPDSMGLKNIVWAGKSYYEPFSPNSKVVSVGNETYAVSPMDVEAISAGAGGDLGAKNVPTTSRTTDPATGQTTVATHTPTTTGAKGRTGGAVDAPASAAPAASAPGSRPSGSLRPASPKPVSAPQLDDAGHIPDTAAHPPQVIEGANQLLDGTDKDKLPTKTRELSAQLARKYGWEQGKFTPKEQVLLRESTTYLQNALSDPSLSVLDDGIASRMQIGQVLSNPDRAGLISRGVTTAAAMGMDERQAAFVRMYNQLVGTISGLGSLVRSGRVTESTINRLKSELPNPTTTTDSADGRKRIQRLLSEIDVAMKKGNFEGTGGASTAPKGLPAPPKASSSSSSSSSSSLDDEIMSAIGKGK